MNNRIRDSIFLFLVITFIFNNIPKVVQLNTLGGVFGGKLVLYPLLIGFIYTAYCQWKYKNILIYRDKFLKFVAAYIGILSLSTVLGFYMYPYFEIVFNGPINQIGKLPKLIDFLHSFNIHIDHKLLLSSWIFIRVLKNVILETVYCFGSAYMIFCWYFYDYKRGLKLLIQGAVAGLLLVLGYGVVDVFFLLGNDTAKNILITVNPYLHTIKQSGSWWPPLLWHGQLRSVFSEPSNIGNYTAFIFPALQYAYYKKHSKYLLILYTMTVFIVVLTKARTAYAMLFGISILCPVLLYYMKRKDLYKKFAAIVLCSLIGFFCGVKVLNYIDVQKNIPKANFSVSTSNVNANNKAPISKPANYKAKDNTNRKITAAKVIEDNFISLASSNQRSNGARYARIKSNLRIFMDYPLLGVGTGLTKAYIIDYYSDIERKNWEVKLWIKEFHKNGVFGAGSSGSALNEYVNRLAQNGILGLLVFIFPFSWLLIKLFGNIKTCDKEKKLDLLFIAFSLITMLVSGCNSDVSVVFATWPLLGLGYAMLFGQDGLGKDTDERA